MTLMFFPAVVGAGSWTRPKVLPSGCISVQMLLTRCKDFPAVGGLGVSFICNGRLWINRTIFLAGVGLGADCIFEFLDACGRLCEVRAAVNDSVATAPELQCILMHQ
jgi:hypothetical protein